MRGVGRHGQGTKLVGKTKRRGKTNAALTKEACAPIRSWGDSGGGQKIIPTRGREVGRGGVDTTTLTKVLGEETLDFAKKDNVGWKLLRLEIRERRGRRIAASG